VSVKRRPHTFLSGFALMEAGAMLAIPGVTLMAEGLAAGAVLTTATGAAVVVIGIVPIGLGIYMVVKLVPQMRARVDLELVEKFDPATARPPGSFIFDTPVYPPDTMPTMYASLNTMIDFPTAGPKVNSAGFPIGGGIPASGIPHGWIDTTDIFGLGKGSSAGNPDGAPGIGDVPDGGVSGVGANAPGADSQGP
jgi:hypothetical protein